MEQYDVIIIGAGPAGLFCAIRCACDGLRVCILEKKESAGRKLLITGSGQCNITHTGTMDEFLEHYGKKGTFLKPALYNFANRDLIDFFAKRGLNMVEQGKGKVFPETLSAGDVLQVLVRECAEKGVNVEYDRAVQSIAKEGNFFELYTVRARFRARAVIIATGGKSYPATGSTGDGYVLAEKLGHHISPPAPALTPVKISDHLFSNCSGISIDDADISLFRKNRKIGRTSGDVLFTHQGLSGPGILDFSRYIEPGDLLKVSVVKFRGPDDFDASLVASLGGNGKKSLKNCLTFYGIPERIIARLLEINGLSSDLKASHVDRKTRKMIADQLTALTFKVERPGDFNEAMVTRGGIPLDEVNKKTMESKVVPHLYFAGEVLDIDGDTGGYNLQSAFSTAALAGKHSAARLRDGM